MIQPMTNTSALLEQARQLHSKGQLESAFHILSELHQGDMNDINVLLELIEVTKNQKKWKEAFEFLGKLFALKPGLVEGHLLYGAVFLGVGSSEKAIAALSRYIQLRPTDPKGYTLMGNALFTRQEFTKALKFYDQVIKMGLQDSSVLEGIAKTHLALGESEKSLSCLSQIIDLDTTNARALNLRGNIYFLQKNWQEAKQDYNQAYELHSDFHDAQLNLNLVKQIEKLDCGQIGETIFLGLPEGKNFGWGICAKYLTQELSRTTNVFPLDYDDWQINGNKSVPGPYFFAIQDVNLTTPYSANGTFNCGYTFFEYDLLEKAKENAAKYDLVLAGSSWCLDRLRANGITNTGLLIQGIDPEHFYPIDELKSDEKFVIFSGGKFEFRKGQDLVLKALQILQEKYDDIQLINIWFNMWPASISTMRRSKHIDYEAVSGSWSDQMAHLYGKNGLDQNRITTYEIFDNSNLRSLYAQTDLGIFPNRCEGGSNLVLMEYMACAKPVIASNATGHRDIVNDQNALLLKNNKSVEIKEDCGRVIARWADPSLEELVAKIEFAYHHRDKIKKIGKNAGNDLKQFTWKKSAKKLLDYIKN